MRWTFKFVVMGDTQTGKTALIAAVKNERWQNEYTPTLGAAFSSKVVSYDISNTNQTATLEIWDASGDEKYRTLLPMYYRGAGVLLFTYSDLASFQQLNGIIKHATSNVGEGGKPLITIVRTKLDLALIENEGSADEIKVGIAELQRTYPEFIELPDCSSKTGENCNTILPTLLEAYLKKEKSPAAINRQSSYTAVPPISEILKANIIAEVETYKTNRENDPRDYKSHFFGRNWGYSKNEKIDAVVALTAFLRQNVNIAPTPKQIKALKQGELGKAITKVLREHLDPNAPTLDALIRVVEQQKLSGTAVSVNLGK